MKLNKNVFLTTLTLAALTAGAWAQTETASNATPPNGYAASAPAPAPPPVTAADIQELKAALAAQQQQIQALQAQLQGKDQALQQLRSGGPSATEPVAVASDSTVAVATNLQETPTEKTSQNAGSSDERIHRWIAHAPAFAHDLMRLPL
jgi:Skp family chaperone for outer membrane proteins